MAIGRPRIGHWVVGGLVAAAVLIQLVPYGRDHANPPVAAEPPWDSRDTRALAVRACFGCHSNETVWPWYSWIAPVSWLVEHDVEDGRSELNFSEWRIKAREGEEPGKVAEQVRSGAMPPWTYRLAHPEARLGPAEKRQLIDGWARTARAAGAEAGERDDD